MLGSEKMESLLVALKKGPQKRQLGKTIPND
jgi:hypothetical protein